MVREDRVEEGRVRKDYTTTERGRRTLAQARHILTELPREVVAGEDPDP